MLGSPSASSPTDNVPRWSARCILSTLQSQPQGRAEEQPGLLQTPRTEREQALAVSSSAFSWQLGGNTHDTCHAHVNSVARNDMQAEDELEMKSRLCCQLPDLCKVGSWSSLQYLHSSRFLPEIPSPGTNVNTKKLQRNKQANSNRCSTLAPSKQLFCCAKPEDPTLLLHQPVRLLSAFSPDT